MPAQFNIDKLTVFEVVVTDATNEALERNSAELGRNSADVHREHLSQRLLKKSLN